MLNLIVFLSLVAILSLISYFITTKYEVSEDSKIAILYLSFPIIEKLPLLFYLITSVILTIPLLMLGFNTLHTISLLILIISLQCMSYIDIKCYRLPNVIMLPTIIASLIPFIYFNGLKETLLGALIGFGVTFFLAIIKSGGLGGGDIKLGLLLGIIFGQPVIFWGLCIGFILGGLFSWFYLSKQVLIRKSYIPYGPFLFLGGLLVYLWKLGFMNILF